MNARVDNPRVDEAARGGEIASRLNWLRAGVLGANDGIVSTAGVVFGVVGASVSDAALLAAGVAAVAAGALSMAVGEYVSVSSQRDSQQSELAREKAQLARKTHGVDQLTAVIAQRGVEPALAHDVAVQLTEKDALAAHARLELGIDPNELTNPWHAALASMIAFVVGGVIPLAAILFAPRKIAVPVTALAVIVALALTGTVSAQLGRAPKLRASVRTIGGGMVAMAVTYGIGALVGGQL